MSLSPPKPSGTCPFVVLVLLCGLTAPGRAETGSSGEETSSKGFRIDQVQQQRTDTFSWLHVEVLADTGPDETWTVLQNVEEWDRHVKLFSRVTPLESNETMTRYRVSVAPPWPIPDFESVIWIERLPDQRRILWAVDQDRLAGNHGMIEVTEAEGGSRILYESYSPAQNRFPKWVVKIGLYLVLPAVIQDFYDWIRHPGN